MNRLLKLSAPRSSFSTSFQPLLQQRANILKAQDTTVYREFSAQLFRVVLFDEMSRRNVRNRISKARQLALLHSNPIKQIVQYFHTRCRGGFNDDLLAGVVTTLGKTYASLRQDGHANRANEGLHEIFFSDGFFNLIEEIKYGLKSGVYFSNKNIALVLEGLTELGYIDPEIISMAIDKVFRKLEKKDDNFNPLEGKPHQAQKLNYYSEGSPIDKAKLLQNEAFRQVLNQILTQADSKTKQDRVTDAFGQKVNRSFKGESNKNQVVELIKSLDKDINDSHKRVIEYADAILSIRNQYLRLIDSQTKKREIMADPNLNLEMLDFEENLLSLGLINIQEVKNPSLIADSKHNLAECANILQRVLNNFNPELSLLIKKTHTEDTAAATGLSRVKSNYKQETRDLGLVLVQLERICSAPFKEYRDYGIAKNKWFNKVVDPNSSSDPRDFTLNCDRLFRQRYLDSVKSVQSGVHQNLQTLKNLRLSYRVHILSSLTQLGLHKEALSLVGDAELAEARGVLQMDSAQIFSLVTFLNNFTGHIAVSEKLLEAISKNLKNHISQGTLSLVSTSKENAQTYAVSIKDLCTLVNFFYNLDQEPKQVLEPVLAEIKNRVNTISNPQSWIDFSYVADVLSGEDASYRAFLSQDSSVFNPSAHPSPLVSKLHETMSGYVQNRLSSREPDQIIKLGHNDLKTKTMAAVAIVPSQFSSIDGQFIDGNFVAHFKRLGVRIQASIKPLSINSALNVSLERHTIDFKPKQEIVKVLHPYVLAREESEVWTFAKDTLRTLLQNLDESSPRCQYSTRLVSNILKTIINLNKTEKTSLSYNVAVASRYKLAYALFVLERQIKLLPYSTESITQKIRSLAQHLKQNEPELKLSGQDLPAFAGLRQSIDTLDSQETVDPKVKWSYEVVDLETYNSDLYLEYQAWENEVKNNLGSFNYSKLNVGQKTSPLVKALLPPTASSVTIVPVHKPRKIRVTPFPVNWTTIYRAGPSQATEKALELEKLVREPVTPTIHTKKIVRLQNLKQELRHKSVSEIAQLLVNFDFIESLIDEHLGTLEKTKSSSDLLLNRNPSDYFDYLEKKPQAYLLTSPYFAYISQKLHKKSKLGLLFEAKNEATKKARAQLAQNEINYSTYRSIIKAHEQSIVEELRSYSENGLGSSLALMEENNDYMFQTEVDRENFAAFLRTVEFYNRVEDPDVIVADGDFTEALKTKRRKSEEKLIKLRITYKQATGIALSAKENQYLQKWTNELINGASNESSFTHRTVASLNVKDKETLSQFTFSRIDLDETIALSDLILELALFYDSQALKRAESQLLMPHLKQHYHINPYILEHVGANKHLAHELNKKEEQVFDNAYKLTPEEINAVLEISGMTKTEGYFDRDDYAKIYAGAKEELELLNGFSSREHLIAEWFRLKEIEFKDRRDSHSTNQYKQENMEKVWIELFKTPYSESTQKELHAASEYICERLYLLSNPKYAPVYVGPLVMKVLTHPNTHPIDRNNLLGTMELVNFRPQIDSADLLNGVHLLQKAAAV